MFCLNASLPGHSSRLATSMGLGLGLFLGRFTPAVTCAAELPAERTVQVELRDAQTEEALAGRVYLVDQEGRHYFARSVAPEGQALVYNVERSPQSLEKHTTVSPHPFEFTVPADATLTLSVERGKE
ncbi:MAG: hypothetical protein ACK5WR_23915, partial [Planctomycetaceae bacterium]